jgi:hypothetical protein
VLREAQVVSIRGLPAANQAGLSGPKSCARCRARSTAGHSGTTVRPRQGHLAGSSPPETSPDWSVPPAPWPMQRRGRQWFTRPLLAAIRIQIDRLWSRRGAHIDDVGCRQLSSGGPILPNEAADAGELRNIGRDQNRSVPQCLGGDQQIIRADRSSGRL